MSSHRGASRADDSVCVAYDESSHDLRAVSMCIRHATGTLVLLHRMLAEVPVADETVAGRMTALGEAVDALSADFLTLVDAIGLVRKREPPMTGVGRGRRDAMAMDDHTMASALDRASEIFRRLSLHLAVRRETAGAPDAQESERDAESLAQTAALHALHDLAVDRLHGDFPVGARALMSTSISVIVDALRGQS